jgi:hypothetical protein
MKSTFTAFGLAAVLLVAAPAFAAPETVEGKVVEVGNGKITVMEKEGKNQYTHEVAADATITCDGKDCRLDDITKECWATITTEKRGEKTVAIKIIAKKSKDQ